MEKLFITHDTLLCSFLLTHKEISLIEIKEQIQGQFIFVLSEPTLCEKLSKEYLNNAQAPARELFSNREILISEIKNKYREGDKYGQ